MNRIAKIICFGFCFAIEQLHGQAFVENFILETKNSNRSLAITIEVTKASDGIYKVVLESEDSLFIMSSKAQKDKLEKQKQLEYVKEIYYKIKILESNNKGIIVKYVDSLLIKLTVKDTTKINELIRTMKKDSLAVVLNSIPQLDSTSIKADLSKLVSKTKGTRVEFTLKPFEKGIFVDYFIRQFIDGVTYQDTLKSKASEMFFKANAYIEIVGNNDEPDAGKVHVNSIVPLYDYNTDLLVGYLGIDQIDFEIYEGYIQNIMVTPSDSILEKNIVSEIESSNHEKREIATGLHILKHLKFRSYHVDTPFDCLSIVHRQLSLKRRLHYLYKNYIRYDSLINKEEYSFLNEKQLIPAFNRSERKTAKRIYKILNNSLNDIRDEAVRKNLEILSTQNPKINLLQQELQSDYRKIFFENKIPIGFSHKNNYRNLYNHRLFCVNPKYSDFYIKLGEVMTYKYEIAEERRDFSPRNGKYVILKNQSVTLKKVATKKILEALVFSDFMGFKKDNPNGLVQFELNKRINTNTFRRQSYRSDFGWIQYATPTFTYNKLENKENAFVNSPNVSQRSDTLNIFSRGDTLRYLGDQITNAKYQITPIDLLRYQQFSTGLDINILDLSINTVKTTFNMNAGLKFGQSRIIDSLYTTRDDTLSRQSTNNVLLKTDIFTNGLVKESKVNTLQWTLECSALISPELRYGFKATYRILAMNMFSSDYDLVSEIGTRVRRTGWVHQAELLGYFNPNSTGKLFFRYRFNFNNKDLDYNFSQLQLGYSFYLVK